MARSCTKHPPARMNKRVTLQSVSRDEDGQGGFTEEWIDGDTIWASIEPLKGWERMQAQQLENPITHKVMIRYRSGVTADMRLIYGDRVLGVKEVINLDEDNAFLRLMCVESGNIQTEGENAFLFQDGNAFLFQDGNNFQM